MCINCCISGSPLQVFWICIRILIHLIQHMFLGLPDPHLDLLVRGMDLRIRTRIHIRTKKSQTPALLTSTGIKLQNNIFFLSKNLFQESEIQCCNQRSGTSHLSTVICHSPDVRLIIDNRRWYPNIACLTFHKMSAIAPASVSLWVRSFGRKSWIL